MLMAALTSLFHGLLKTLHLLLEHCRIPRYPCRWGGLVVVVVVGGAGEVVEVLNFTVGGAEEVAVLMIVGVGRVGEVLQYISEWQVQHNMEVRNSSMGTMA